MLSWQQAAILTAVLATLGIALTLVPNGRAHGIAPAVRECAIIAGLYALWQLAGNLSVVGTDGAFARARWIQHAERVLHLPSEASVQRAVTDNSVTAQAANLYYASMHFGVLFVFLLWLFFRHRDQYRPVRRVLALTTFVCLLIQLVPVAPPRLLPGYVDVAVRYGQSVYDPAFGFGADQLSAMPSVHVAWAALVGWQVYRLGTGAWRLLGPAHTVLTVLVVVSTNNHWWADGAVAVAVLALCAALERAARAMIVRVLSARRVETAAQPEHSALMEAS